MRSEPEGGEGGGEASLEVDAGIEGGEATLSPFDSPPLVS